MKIFIKSDKLLIFFLLLKIICAKADNLSYEVPPINSNAISNIVIDYINIWCATNGGLVKWDKNNKTYDIYTPEDGLLSFYVKSCVIDSSRVLWFNYWGFDGKGGVTSYDGNNFKTYNIKNSGISDDNVLSLSVDNNNVKWFGTQKGITKFDNTNYITYYLGKSVPAIAIDLNNVKWLVIENIGLVSYDDITWTTYSFPKNIDISLFNVISVDLDNIKWIGTAFHGVWSFDGVNWKQYTVKDGLSHDWVETVMVDYDNKKWFGTLGGISVFNGQTWTTYTENNGLLYNKVGAIAKDNDDTIWIGTWKGLQSFNGNVWTSYIIPHTLIESTKSPFALSILSNHPNPFNTATTISFILPSSGLTSLVIYNIIGQKVREIVSDTMSVGKHSVIWNGKDNNGASVSSGVYIARLTMGKYTASRLLTFVK